MLGSKIEITLPACHSFLFPACFDELARIEQAYSRFITTSELSALNSNLGKWQDASEEMVFLLRQGELFREQTEGNFDLTIKSALDKLGYDKDYSFRLKNGRGNATQNAPGGNILIDEKNLKVLMHRQIDFGGFGKGYAADRAAQLLDLHGAQHYCINAGGDIFARRGRGAEPWEILLEHPDDPSRAIGKIAIDGEAVAGSAPNRRKWGGKGQHHHLINPKTRKPAMESKAIFALAKTGVEADAYATAIFCAGFEQGILLSQKLPVQVLSVSPKGKMHQSAGFKAEIFD